MSMNVPHGGVHFQEGYQIPPSYLKQDTAIKHFDLSGLLPPTYLLAMHERLRTISLLSFTEQSPRLVIQVQFSHNELLVVGPLLASYPHYCPHEVLHAAFFASLNDESIARSRQTLQEAEEEGRMNDTMRPVRNIIAYARAKLREVGISPVSIIEVGYILIAYQKNQ